ncbi:MAG: hypothetical protein BWK78_06865 [Thiotrichaceae bacterium IS1]|nr:MAG: hypothetical protein BWK78_06865 [Thiotrichaceae bacterium IS1]
MINFKQEELSLNLFKQLQARFPDIELVSIDESPIYPDNIWISVVMPKEDDRYIELRELSAEISTDILLDYGYHISTISGRRQQAGAVA